MNQTPIDKDILPTDIQLNDRVKLTIDGHTFSGRVIYRWDEPIPAIRVKLSSGWGTTIVPLDRIEQVELLTP